MTQSSCAAARWDGAELAGARLHGADFAGASLREVWLQRADAAQARFRSADFTGAKLHGVRFVGADLRDANVTDAELSDADLTGACIDGLTGAPAEADRLRCEWVEAGGERLDGAVLFRRLGLPVPLHQRTLEELGAETHWAALDENAFARWSARAADQRKLVLAILAAGAATGVFRLVSTDEDGGDVQPIDHELAADARLEPELPEGRHGRVQGTICWYEDGELREGEVAWLAELLHRLRPDAVVPDWHTFMGWVAPVDVWIGRNAVHISVPTDVWFPRVAGLLDGETYDLPWEASVDNSALAARHTPRLNAFLRTVRAAADEWELLEAEDVGVRYAHLVDEHGIRLDA